MNSFEHLQRLKQKQVIEEPISHAYEQSKMIYVGIFVNEKRTTIKIISKERQVNINTLYIIDPSEENFYIKIKLCVPNYQVPPISLHQQIKALKKHVTMHKYIYTEVFYLGYKVYRNEYITVVNYMDWLPFLG